MAQEVIQNRIYVLATADMTSCKYEQKLYREKMGEDCARGYCLGFPCLFYRGTAHLRSVKVIPPCDDSTP